MIRFARRSQLLSLASVVVLSACSGGSGGPGVGPEDGAETEPAAGLGSEGGDDHPMNPAGADGESVAVPADNSSPGDAADVIAPAPGEATRAARLTHNQYQNTVEDLLGISDDFASGFAPDALNGFAFQTSIDLRVDSRLAPQYRAAAEELGVMAREEVVWSRLTSCADVGCADQFIAEFLERAFRRPADPEELARFRGILDQAPELVASGDAWRDGVQLVVEAALQSPQFLYRTELSDAAVDDVIALDDWEMASRLSYFIYNSMPDPELFAAAREGRLHAASEITAEVERMLTEPRALRSLVAFHEQAWHFDRFSSIAPDPQAFGDVPEDMSGLVSVSSDLFLEDVISGGGGLAELLTAPYAFVNSSLAPLYGVSVDGDFERVALDGDRKGFLMQLGFLTSNAHTRKTDPIHRGLFIVRDLLCQSVPDPPPGASQTMLPEGTPAPETTREEVSLLTGTPDCVACHSRINPAGFAFEGFDAAGQTRTEENGVLVDVSGELMVDGEVVAFSGPGDLVEALAESPEAQRCYVARWLQFAHGRRLTAEELERAALNGDRSIGELVAAVASSALFTTRTPNEVAR